MNLKKKLSERIGIDDIHEILYLVENSDKKQRELYDLLYDSEDRLAYQAAWVMTHYSWEMNRCLLNKRDELIDEVLRCGHAGKRRLLLNLIYRQPLPSPIRTDFLDFCLERMISKQELPGVQTLCMKLAYEQCRPVPELLREFDTLLDIMEVDLLPISIRTVQKNIRKAMKQGKSLQSLS